MNSKSETAAMRDTHGVIGDGWYGFDLDGTLARYDGWKGIDHIGEPIAPMVELMKRMHDAGDVVKVMTARAAPRDVPEMRPNPYFESGVPGYVRQNDSTLKYLYYTRLWDAKMFVRDWCLKNLGFLPEITHQKDGLMITLYDDRVKQVVPNTGILVENLVEQGNASALRKALEDTEELLEHFAKPGTILHSAFYLHMRDNRAALSAPARNCDRFATAEEAENAFVEFCARASSGKVPNWRCSITCGHIDPSDWVACCIKWLFALAEGGAK